MRSLVGAVLNRAPVPYTGRSARLALPFGRRNDAEAQMRAYGNVGTIFSIVHRTSVDAAKVEWHLWRKAASGRKEDRVEVVQHAAKDLWDRPNPFYTGREFRETLLQHRDLTGECWWLLGRDPRSPLPLELWPVRPDRMAPVPSPTEFISGYVYTGPDGEKVPLDLADVFQVKMPNPLDPYRGLGPVQSVMIDVDSARYSAEWNRNFFINSAEPGGLIKVDKRLSDDEFNEMSDRWREQHQGVAQAHRVAIIEQGEWIDRKFTMRDMQFAELRGVSREIIREAFGMSKTMLGASESETNRATAEAAEYVYSKYQIVERLDGLKGVLNSELLPLYGPEAAAQLEFDYEDPVPENAEALNAARDSKVAAAVALIGIGADPAETFEAYDLPALTVVKPTPPPPPEPPALAPPAPAALPPATRSHHHHHGPRNADDNPGGLDQVQEDWEKALDDLLGDWDRKGISAAMREDLADQIEAAVDDGDLEALAEIAVTLATLADGEDLLNAAMGDLTSLAARRMAAEADDQGVDVDPVPGDSAVLGAFAATVVALLGNGLATSAAREALRRAREGAEGAAVADEVVSYLEGLSDATLRDLLGGALTKAQNDGRIATLKAAPEAAYYADETLDGNTCINCRRVDGKWLGNSLDEVESTYPNGGYRECLGRERCRGTVVAVWRPEQVGE